MLNVFIQQTPIHFAVMNLSTSCLQALLEWGGDLYQRDKDGKSPMDCMTTSSPLSFGLTIQQYSGKVTCITAVTFCNQTGFQGVDNDLNYIARKLLQLCNQILISINSELQSIMLGKDVKESFDEFSSVFSLLSPHQRALFMRSEVSNQTLLYRCINYYSF